MKTTGEGFLFPAVDLEVLLVAGVSSIAGFGAALAFGALPLGFFAAGSCGVFTGASGRSVAGSG